MAGIGFTLRRLTRQDNLLGIIQGYALSSLVSTGPWLFTITALGGINIMGARMASVEMLSIFRLVVTYNFAFSLVLSGPLLMVATRYLADRIYEKKVEEAPGMMLAGLGILFAAGCCVAVPFYGFFLDLTPLERLAAIANFLLICGVWLVGLFLSAIRDYKTITAAFGIGMAVSMTLAVALIPTMGTAGMLIGFSGGLCLIMFTLIGRIFAEYPYRIQRPFAFLQYFRRYWDLALGGLVYNLAIWVDKWVMWSSSEHEVQAGGLLSYPNYDSAMFLAYLTIVPAMAMFVLDIETGFFEYYQRFYRDIQTHATFARLKADHHQLLAIVVEKLRNLMVLQGAITAVAILMAPRLFDFLGVNYLQLGIFRLGALGAFFHMLLLFITIILSYFDLRRSVLALNLLFLVANFGFSALSLRLGFAFHGYGYFLACLSVSCVGYAMAAYELSRLPYLAFLKTNTSI